MQIWLWIFYSIVSHRSWKSGLLYGPLDITLLLVENIWGAFNRLRDSSRFVGCCVVCTIWWITIHREPLRYWFPLLSSMNYIILVCWENICWDYSYFVGVSRKRWPFMYAYKPAFVATIYFLECQWVCFNVLSYPHGI